MYKLLILILLILLSAFSSACSVMNNKQQESITVIESDDIFEIKLYLDKDIYREDEVIDCYAILEYIGDDDSILVYSSSSLVNFGLIDGKYFDGDYIVNNVLVTTEFKKGKTIRYDFTKSGSWHRDDPYAEFYKKYFEDKELRLPSGEYEIFTEIVCSIGDPGIPKYKLKAKADIKINK